jgi:hypothetical protein
MRLVRSLARQVRSVGWVAVSSGAGFFAEGDEAAGFPVARERNRWPSNSG